MKKDNIIKRVVKWALKFFREEPYIIPIGLFLLMWIVLAWLSAEMVK